MDKTQLITISTIVSAFTALIVTWIKAKIDRKKDLLNWAMQAAIKDFELTENKNSRRTISSHLYFHFHWLEMIDKGKANEEALVSLTKKAYKLSDASKNI